MSKRWKINPIHKKVIGELFEPIGKKVNTILDAGSGRTSLYFLTKKFPKSKITAIIYPGDKRKSEGIKESIHNDFLLKEVDIKNFDPIKKFDVVLAHLLLGEATKFNKNKFDEILDSLFKIKSKFIVIIDVFDDPEVNYGKILKKISSTGEIKKVYSKDKYLGFLIERK
ncbi:hypothetical protein COU58_03430 [Candidatus Pacearchaeota archaeon CG10_big_fil_rev_8_21_14_0_10_32_42]|nr:MAG: hypothetical protein COU58_03430 [Candidatus Pacearchaeota archaeon CG10_big_fil_rev_8_21_14_0_10_32_42]